MHIGTATLIHPRVVLTAGHGTSPAEAALKDGSLRIENLLIGFAEDATNPSTWRAINRVITHPDYSPDGPSFFGSGPVSVADVGVVIPHHHIRIVNHAFAIRIDGHADGGPVGHAEASAHPR